MRAAARWGWVSAVYLIMAGRVTASRPAGFVPLATFFVQRQP